MVDLSDDDRSRAHQLYQDWRRAAAAVEALPKPSVVLDVDALMAEYKRRLSEMREWFFTELSRLEGDTPLSARRRELSLAARTAWDEYQMAELPELLLDDDGDPIICAASGLPIWRGEDHLCCAATGAFYLSSVVLSAIDADHTEKPDGEPT